MINKIKTSAYASFDIEADGNNPIQHSMRSIGVALFTEGNTKPIATFYKTLEPQLNTRPEKKCIEDFWNRFPQKWDEVNTNTIIPEQAMSDLSDWLKNNSVNFSIKWVASPSNFDWMFLKCYYEKYGKPGKYDIGFFCHDLSSLLRSFIISKNVKDKKTFLLNLSNNQQCNHNALDDAICQGVTYINLRALLTFNKFSS
jgi:hypothetical protein